VSRRKLSSGKSCGEERNTSLCPLHICGSTALFQDSLLQATICVGLHFGTGMMTSELSFAASKLKQFSSLYASVKLSLSGHIFLLERSFTDDCIFCVLCDCKRFFFPWLANTAMVSDFHAPDSVVCVQILEHRKVTDRCPTSGWNNRVLWKSSPWLLRLRTDDYCSRLPIFRFMFK